MISYDIQVLGGDSPISCEFLRAATRRQTWPLQMAGAQLAPSCTKVHTVGVPGAVAAGDLTKIGR